MASKIVAFSPTHLLVSNNHSTSVNSIRPFSVIFPSARNPIGLSAVKSQSNGSHEALRLRQWAIDASPAGKSNVDQKWTEEGLITESLPDGKFRVKLDNGDTILGYLSGKIRQRFIRVMPGDRVKIEVSRYDLTKGRITYRLRTKDKFTETPED